MKKIISEHVKLWFEKNIPVIITPLLRDYLLNIKSENPTKKNVTKKAGLKNAARPPSKETMARWCQEANSKSFIFEIFGNLWEDNGIFGKIIGSMWNFMGYSDIWIVGIFLDISNL